VPDLEADREFSELMELEVKNYIRSKVSYVLLRVVVLSLDLL